MGRSAEATRRCISQCPIAAFRKINISQGRGDKVRQRTEPSIVVNSGIRFDETCYAEQEAEHEDT